MSKEEERHLAAAQRWVDLYNNQPADYVDAWCAPEYGNRFFPTTGGWSEVQSLEALRETARHVPTVVGLVGGLAVSR